MLKVAFLLVISLFTFDSSAGITYRIASSTLVDHSVIPSGCSSLPTCLATHVTFVDGARTYAPTGEYRFLNYNGYFSLPMKYLSDNGNTSEYSLIFNYTDDCYVTGSVMKCGLECNSESTCFAIAASQCAFLSQYHYTNPSSWSRTCTTVESEGNLEGSIGQTDNYNVIATGSTGATGATGADGANGLDGIDGVVGTDGLDGVDGTDGTDGVNGTDGEIGLSGTDGVDGTDGEDGSNGIDGFNGLDGSQGPIGQTGAKGERGEVDEAVLDDLQRIDTLLIDRLNNLDQNDFEQDELLGTAQADLFTLFQKDLVLESGQALIDADVETNELNITSLNTSVAQLQAAPPVTGIDGVDGEDGTNGTNGSDGVDGTDGEDGTNGLTGAAGLDGSDGTNGVNGLAGEDGENVDTQAVVTAINESNNFLKGDVTLDAAITNFSAYDSLFDNQQQVELLDDIETLKDSIKLENSNFLATVKSKFTFTSSASGYESRVLDLSNWGSHDVSISRFAEHYGGIGNIIYFFASLLALSIVLSGVRL